MYKCVRIGCAKFLYMQSILKYKKIIIAVLVFLVGFFVYNSFFKPDTELDGLLVQNVSTSSQSEAGIAGREIIALLADIQKITLDKSIFESVVFRSLEDFSIPIEPEPKGRVNPFAPLDDTGTTTSGAVPAPGL